MVEDDVRLPLFIAKQRKFQRGEITLEAELCSPHRNGFALMDYPGESAFLGRVVGEQVRNLSFRLFRLTTFSCCLA